MEWMEETAMAVENRLKNAGRGNQFGRAELHFSTGGMEVLFPQKRDSKAGHGYRVAGAAVTGL